MTIINDDSRVVNKLEASVTDDDRVIIYNRYMFIVQATGLTALLDCLLCFVPATIAYFQSGFLQRPLTQLTLATRLLVCAINQCVRMRCLWYKHAYLFNI
jgi:hypothetical protein